MYASFSTILLRHGTIDVRRDICFRNGSELGSIWGYRLFTYNKTIIDIENLS